MVSFVFTKQAKKAFSKLPKIVQKRLLEKLKELKNHQDIFSALKRLNDMEPATHRLRIGNYRLILALLAQNKNNIEFWVLDIGHRKDIYR